jgi:hypothetical protein
MRGGLTMAAPGGVQQVGSVLDLIMGTEGWNGALQISTCAAKDETAFIELSYTGVKTGGCGAKIPNMGFELKASTAALWKATFKASIFGAEADKSTAKSEG